MNESKKIEPTDAMVDKAANTLALHATGMSLRHQEDWDVRSYRKKARAALHVALNDPDALGLFADVDDRPWEPLKKGDPLHVGDEVRQDYSGVTRTAVVGRVGEDGTPWTTERDLIGLLHWGTWYVRHPIVSKEEGK